MSEPTGPAAPRRLRVLPVVAAIAAAALGGYGVATASGALPLDPGRVGEALASGSFAGHSPIVFVASCIVPFLMASALGLLALRAPTARVDDGPWRRLALALAPWCFAPMVLTQDDPVRRPALLAMLLGASAASVAYAWARDREASAAASRGRLEHVPAIAVVVAHFVVFATLAVRRDHALWSATVDLGIFKEALWSTLHGRVMYSPTVGYSFLGEHFSPVLFLLVPLYALSPTSGCLLVVQTAAVSLAAWPVYLLGRDLGLRRGTATVLVAAMLFSPPLHTALLYDFHMDLLAAPAMAWLVLALHRRHFGHALVAVALLVSVKEDMFVPATAAVLACAAPGDARDRRWSAAIGTLALLWCGLAMAVLLKRFGPPPGVPVYMSDGTDGTGYKFLRNFRHLSGPGGPVLHLLGQPFRYLLWAFSDARLTTFVTLLAPTAFVALAAGLRLPLLLPLAIIMLSDNPEIVALRYHYSAIQHPGLYAAAAYGLARLRAQARHGAAVESAFGAYAVVATVVLLRTHPASLASVVHATDTRAVTPHIAAVDRLVERIPAAVPVSVSTWIGPRVSNRPWSALFPNGLERAEWVLADLQRPPWPANVEQRDAVLLQLMRNGFGAVAWEDGAVLLHRGESPRRNPEAIRDLFVRRRYEVEGTEQTEFSNCSVADPRASDGRARVVSPGDPRPPGFLVFGPFIHLPPGRWEVTFRLAARRLGAPTDAIGYVDVFRQPGVTLVRRDLEPSMFRAPGWVDVRLEFTLDGPRGADGLEFRVHTERMWELGADVVSFRAVDDEDGAVRAMITGR